MKKKIINNSEWIDCSYYHQDGLDVCVECCFSRYNKQISSYSKERIFCCQHPGDDCPISIKEHYEKEIS